MSKIETPTTKAANTAEKRAPGRLPETVGSEQQPDQTPGATRVDPRFNGQHTLRSQAVIVRRMQRTLGNAHVSRVLSRVQSQGLSQPEVDVRRAAPAEAPAEADAPTEAQKAAALKAAAEAEAAAVATRAKGADQTGKAKAEGASEKTAAQAAKQQAITAGAVGKSVAQAGKEAAKSAGATPPAAMKAKPAIAINGASANGKSMDGAAAANGKAPDAPEKDPAFQAVVAKVKGVAAKQQAHPSAKSKADAAQAAAEAPAAELASKAQAGKVGKMQQAEAPPFDAAGFKAKLMEKIAAAAPKNTEEADSFKESDKLGGVKGDMQGNVAQEQQKSQGPLKQETAAEPDASGVQPKPVTPLQPAEPGAPPAPIGAAGAAPKPKTSAELEKPLQEDNKQVDQKMAEADVTEDQLKQSNEPEFQGAVDAKQQAKEHAQAGPQEFRQAEQAQIGAAQTEAGATAQERAGAMHAERAGILQQVGGQQTRAKSKDEQERAKVAADIQNIYNETKASVEGKLNGLDAKVTQAFDQGAAAAKKTFEDFVESRMNAFKERRYGGWLGWARWARDKIAGMPPEVNAFYSEGRNLYLREMDAVIDRVVAIIGKTITEAKAEIARGKQRIQEYVAKLPANLKGVGNEAAQEMQSQFESLEQSVDSKQDELIDSLANKYRENLQAVDARIEELKAANRGLVDKAMDAIGGAIRIILQLKDMLLNVLSRVADAIGKIIKNPIGFLGNLISGVKQGLMNFVSNIGTHLKKGLMTWLFGELAQAGIEIPTSFDLKGILTLVMQILGMTWQFIRAQAVKILGERVVATLEGAFAIFKIIKDQGIGGLWEYIKEQLGNLKEMVLDGIKDMVITQVIQAGIQWLLGILGGPAGAFIKAAKAIIDIVMWFVNNGSRVIALVNSVIDSVGAIASGNVGQAAKYIEDSLGKAVPIMIGFLASLLGLGNLGQKIRGIIQKIQQPVQKAIGWVLGKAKAFATKVMGKVKGAFGKKESEADKQKRLEKGLDAGVAAVNRLKGRRITEGLIRPVLGALKLRYRLGVLEPVVQNGYWAVHGEIQRSIRVSSLRVGAGKLQELDNNILVKLLENNTAIISQVNSQKASGMQLAYNYSTRAEFILGGPGRRAALQVLEQKYDIKLIGDINPDAINKVAKRLQSAFAGTGRVLRDPDARVAATAFLGGQRLSTNDLKFFKRAKDLGIAVDYIGSGDAAKNASAYVPVPVAIPPP